LARRCLGLLARRTVFNVAAFRPLKDFIDARRVGDRVHSRPFCPEPEAVDELMISHYELTMASLLGLGTTSSSPLETAIALYVPFSETFCFARAPG
jgi:hypothetical protein